MQWGTPADLAEYQKWSNIFLDLNKLQFHQPYHLGTVMVPMAGEGRRFKEQGYIEPKPLIKVLDQPMIIQAVNYLPKAGKHIFITRENIQDLKNLNNLMQAKGYNSAVVKLEALTDGQARTCLMALKEADLDLPLTIGACDSGVIYDKFKFEEQFANEDADIIVWVARNHINAARKPHMYGWVETIQNSNKIDQVSVKKPLNNPHSDPIVVGIFTFKKAKYFKQAVEHMINRNGKINGEFYIDESINDAISLGLKCNIFEVDYYLSWGTPEELETFNYWHSCFKKYKLHPFDKQNHEE